MLAVEVELADGGRMRYGPDEADVGDVPTDISCDSELPGGFGPANITLPRPDRFDPLQAKLWAATRIYEAETNRTFHEGRIVGTPAAGASQISLEVEGFSKALDDDRTARLLGLDIDKGNWEQTSVERQIANAATLAFKGTESIPDDTTGQPALSCLFDPGEGSTSRIVVSEAVYDAGAGNRIGYVDYAWKISGINSADANWSWVVYAAVSDLISGTPNATGNLRAAGPGAGTLTTSGGDKRFASVIAYYNANTVHAIKAIVAWTLLGVVGTHGIPLQGSVAAPATGRGLLVSDVCAHLLGRFAPSLSYSTGVGGSIAPTSFAVPHLVFREDTTATEMIEALVMLGGTTNQPLDWGVYDNREFFLKSPGAYGRVWRMRLDEGGEEDDSGPDASRRLNGIKVVYDDGTGSDHSVGPPGSGSDTETTALLDTDPSNPTNTRGERHWESFSAGVTSAAGALLIGQLILAERNRTDWRGEVTVRGDVLDSTGNSHPVAAIRAGDRVVNEDSNDTTERRIIGTSYDNAARANRVSIGQPGDRLDVILARANVVLEGRIA